MERDELIAFAEDKGLKVDRRLGDDKLRDSIEAQLTGEESVSRDWGDGDPVEPAAETESTEAPEPVVEEPAVEEEPAPVGSVWPKRIAPTVWLHEDGSRTWA